MSSQQTQDVTSDAATGTPALAPSLPPSRTRAASASTTGRQWAIAALGTVAICAAGAMAIYVIHRTMPQQPDAFGQRPGIARSQDVAQRPTGVVVSGSVTTSPTGPAGTVRPPEGVPRSATATTEAARGKADVAGELLGAAAGPRPPGSLPSKPTRVAGDVQVANETARRPTNAADVGTPARSAQGAKSGGEIAWSRDTAKPTADATAGASAARKRGRDDAAPSAARADPAGFPPRPVDSRPEAPGRAGDGSATIARADTQALTKSATEGGRLAGAQAEQCAEGNLFSRLICDERVRLRFCRNRWNDHPDCVIAEPQRNP
jgi:hypothetical protein